MTKGYGVKYWEIGNENYGNGHYGDRLGGRRPRRQEPDRVRPPRRRVRRRDEGGRPDHQDRRGADHAGQLARRHWSPAATTGTWNQTVLSIAGPKIDFVIVHWYPGGLRQAPARSADIDAISARQQITEYAGPGSERIGISMTEFNTGTSSNGTNTQPGALVRRRRLRDAARERRLHRRLVEHPQRHRQRHPRSTGHTDYGDFGLLSSGTCTSDGSVCEPALNTPFAPYYALRMMSVFARPGDQFVRAASDQAKVSAHAVRRPNGDLAVLLVNDLVRHVAPRHDRLFRLHPGRRGAGRADPHQRRHRPHRLDLGERDQPDAAAATR